MAKRHKSKRFHLRFPRRGQKRKIPWKPVGIAAAVLAGIVLLVLMARPTATLVGSAEVAAIRKRGILRVGLLSDMPGYHSGGEGLEAELARELARRIFPDSDTGISLQIVEVNPKTAIPRLKQDEVDILLSQMDTTGTDYALSDAYASDPVVLLCDPRRVNTPLRDGSVGVVQESAGQRALNSGLARDGAEWNVTCTAYASYPDLLHALETGAVLAAAIPKSRLADYQGQWGVHTYCPGSIAYRAVAMEENEALTQLINVILSDWEADGTLAALRSRFGLD